MLFFQKPFIIHRCWVPWGFFQWAPIYEFFILFNVMNKEETCWSLWHFTGDLRLKCDISRLLLLTQNPDWLIFSYRFLRRSATSFPTQTKTTFQNSGGSFGNWQYIFMRQKGKTLWRNPIFHIADIFYAFDVCMLPAKLSSFFSKGELHQTSRFFAAIQ